MSCSHRNEAWKWQLLPFFFFLVNRHFSPLTCTVSSPGDELTTLPGTSTSVAMPRTPPCPGWWHRLPGEGCWHPGAPHTAARAGNASLLPAVPVLEIKSVSTRGRGKDVFWPVFSGRESDF